MRIIPQPDHPEDLPDPDDPLYDFDPSLGEGDEAIPFAPPDEVPFRRNAHDCAGFQCSAAVCQ